MAALRAPLMATVATGTPDGICTMESSESSPPRSDVRMGTPMTGRSVMEATTPGSAAALPAPAMITLRPRDSALERVLAHRLRVAVGREHVDLIGDAAGLQLLGRDVHDLRVRLGPHQDPHQRLIRHLPSPRVRACCACASHFSARRAMSERCCSPSNVICATPA